jgi:hypothetical protein
LPNADAAPDEFRTVMLPFENVVLPPALRAVFQTKYVSLVARLPADAVEDAPESTNASAGDRAAAEVVPTAPGRTNASGARRQPICLTSRG